jgi:tRNA threonylcarbamoyl adenosine modification protein (Sua5/YciO/YrdC/YwlC family)
VTSIERAARAIKAGEVVGMPTDTVYGIGVDPLNRRAVDLLFELKGRDADRPIGLLAASLDQARQVGVIEGAAEELAMRHWPGALTLVVAPATALVEGIGDPRRGTVGVRVPDHPVTLGLLAATGPLAVTSANLAGHPETTDDVAARAVFGDRVAVYMEGESPGREASTVVDVTVDPPVVLRPGPVRVSAADH